MRNDLLALAVGLTLFIASSLCAAGPAQKVDKSYTVTIRKIETAQGGKQGAITANRMNAMLTVTENDSSDYRSGGTVMLSKAPKKEGEATASDVDYGTSVRITAGTFQLGELRLDIKIGSTELLPATGGEVVVSGEVTRIVHRFKLREPTKVAERRDSAGHATWFEVTVDELMPIRPGRSPVGR